MEVGNEGICFHALVSKRHSFFVMAGILKPVGANRLGGGCLRIFVDLVALINFMVDFLLILGTNRLAGFPPGFGRAVVAAALGGVYGGACLMPGFSFLGNALWRAISLCAIAVVAFGWNRSALQRGGVFVLLSMALGGIAIGIGDEGMMGLFISTGLMWLLCRIGFRGSVGKRSYIPVQLTWGGHQMRVIALKDTGNTLHDPLTGEQVLVAGADVGMNLLGLTEHQLQHPMETVVSGCIPGMRLIPYHAVGQPNGMMLAVRFQNAKIGGADAQPLVAFAPEKIARGDMYQMLTGGAV